MSGRKDFPGLSYATDGQTLRTTGKILHARRSGARPHECKQVHFLPSDCPLTRLPDFGLRPSSCIRYAGSGWQSKVATAAGLVADVGRHIKMFSEFSKKLRTP